MMINHEQKVSVTFCLIKSVLKGKLYTKNIVLGWVLWEKEERKVESTEGCWCKYNNNKNYVLQASYISVYQYL
jgi:hypothetical protein